MPYTKKPRPYQKEYSQQVDRGEHEARMERQRARRKLDKEGVARKGKDVAHVKALSKGGSNKNGLRVESASTNRSFKRNSQHKLVSEVSTKERKKK
jgi:hypothetical protein